MQEAKQPSAYMAQTGIFGTMDEFHPEREKHKITGDFSPNVERTLPVREFMTQFKVNDGDGSKDDGLLLLCRTRIGTNAEGQGIADTMLMVNGHGQVIVEALAEAFLHSPKMLRAFKAAEHLYASKLADQVIAGNSDGVVEMIHGLMGRASKPHKSDTDGKK